MIGDAHRVAGNRIWRKPQISLPRKHNALTVGAYRGPARQGDRGGGCDGIGQRGKHYEGVENSNFHDLMPFERVEMPIYPLGRTGRADSLKMLWDFLHFTISYSTFHSVGIVKTACGVIKRTSKQRKGSHGK